MGKITQIISENLVFFWADEKYMHLHDSHTRHFVTRIVTLSHSMLNTSLEVE